MPNKELQLLHIHTAQHQDATCAFDLGVRLLDPYLERYGSSQGCPTLKASPLDAVYAIVLSKQCTTNPAKNVHVNLRSIRFVIRHQPIKTPACDWQYWHTLLDWNPVSRRWHFPHTLKRGEQVCASELQALVSWNVIDAGSHLLQHRNFAMASLP